MGLILCNSQAAAMNWAKTAKARLWQQTLMSHMKSSNKGKEKLYFCLGNKGCGPAFSRPTRKACVRACVAICFSSLSALQCQLPLWLCRPTSRSSARFCAASVYSSLIPHNSMSGFLPALFGPTPLQTPYKSQGGSSGVSSVVPARNAAPLLSTPVGAALALLPVFFSLPNLHFLQCHRSVVQA